MSLRLPSTSLSSSISSSAVIRNGLLAYGVFVGALMAYSLRWRYLGDVIFARQPKILPIIKVLAGGGGGGGEEQSSSVQNEEEEESNKSNKNHQKEKKKKKPIVVLLHGMWHDASWYGKLQQMLKARGYSTYAIDLLPGERFLVGFTQKEIVADLKETLLVSQKQQQQQAKQQPTAEDGGDDDYDYILVGHSQGGLVVQSCLLNSPEIKARTKAIVLLGTFPLGFVPPFKELLNQPRHMYKPYLGYAGICFFGKLFTLEYLKHIFLLPTTDVQNAEEINQYATQILNAPSDGLITMSHFPQEVGIISTKPTLVLGAKEDVIYPPHLLQNEFNQRFPNSSHKIIPNQAHCFMDGGTEMEDTMIDWFDNIITE